MHKPYSYKSYIYITCNIYIMIIVHKMYIVIYLICKYLNMPTYLIDFRMAYDCYGMAGLVWFILLRQIVWQRQALGGTVNHQGVSLCNTAPKSRQESSNHHQQIINKSSSNHQTHGEFKNQTDGISKPLGFPVWPAGETGTCQIYRSWTR